MKKVTFQGWKNCIELTSGKFKVIVTTEIGPRVMGAFYGKSENLFNVDPELAGKAPKGDWVNYGGHRLWHAPESKPRTYELDNGEYPVTVQKREDGGCDFITPGDPVTGISKVLSVIPNADETFQIIHIIRNDGAWPIEAAAWALSVMAPGGTAVVPQNQDEFQLLPTTFYAVWPYTKMNDPRITWGDKFLIVRQDKKAKTPLKVGFNCKDGWISYINKGVAFVKQFLYDEGSEYPDNGCSVEVYTNKDMLEAETLSPLEYLEPGEEIVHMELWSAFQLDGLEVKTEEDAILLFGEDDCCCDDDCCCEDDCCCHEEEVKPAKKAAAKKTAKKAEKKPAKKAKK